MEAVRHNSMNIREWEQILSKFRIANAKSFLPPGNPRPVALEDLLLFESATGFKLPESYKNFCQVFGPCALTKPSAFKIATPGPITMNTYYNIIKLNTEYKSESVAESIRPYCNDWERVERACFFATDIGTSDYFWDPAEITDRVNNEYAIYIMNRSCEVTFLARSFESLVIDIWLGSGVPEYDTSEPFEWVMIPAGINETF